MKYLGTKPSVIDNDVEVYMFSLGIEELKLLYGAIYNAHVNTPKTFELSPFRARLKNMRRVIEKMKLSQLKTRK